MEVSAAEAEAGLLFDPLSIPISLVARPLTLNSFTQVGALALPWVYPWYQHPGLTHYLTLLLFRSLLCLADPPANFSTIVFFFLSFRFPVPFLLGRPTCRCRGTWGASRTATVASGSLWCTWGRPRGTRPLRAQHLQT